MIIPKYWAEHKERRKCNPKSITVKRIGWSDVSQYEAEKMAENRVDEAFKKIESGEKVVFITRNIYGAQCLNVKDVLFIDKF